MKIYGKHFQTLDDLLHFDFKAENLVNLWSSISKIETEHQLALLQWASSFGYEISHRCNVLLVSLLHLQSNIQL